MHRKLKQEREMKKSKKNDIVNITEKQIYNLHLRK